MTKKFTTIYTHSDVRSLVFATQNDDPDLAQQSDADECDINIIMKKYGAGGMLPQRTDLPKSGDFTAVTDFRSALDLVDQAREAFADVPAAVRKQFNNDPAQFMAFMENPENKDEIKKLGLAKAEKIPETSLADIAKILKEQNGNSNNQSPSNQSASGPGGQPGPR
ncbi:MAG: internal scaffolding protein [Microvirus sp.]|nr:MAG: internal scaffolding protein [Microvirus sp.]